MKWKPVVMVNASAGNDRGLEKWSGIRKRVLDRLPSHTPVLVSYTVEEGARLVHTCLEKGYNCFLGAGGDGTIHGILNFLMKYPGPEKEAVAIGGIGLGSSNDFHKPYKDKIKNIPLRIQLSKAAQHDVGQVLYTDAAGQGQKIYFLINASLGITAEANWLFNRKDAFLSLTKSKMTSIAIAYAALRTIVSFHNMQVNIHTCGYQYQGLAANIAILKNPHVSGKFRYDPYINAQDAQLGLSVCENLSRFALLHTLVDLSRGKFAGKKGRISIRTQKLKISTAGPVPFETDGEVSLGQEFEFSLMPSAIHILME